jgi:phage repressor protein C with HTH and peptisase S24 domain
MIEAFHILIFQAVIDLVLILIIIYLLFFRQKKDAQILKSQKETLEKLIIESDRSAQAFKESLSEDIDSIRRLILEQEEKERQLRRLIRESEELLRREGQEQKVAIRNDATDAYREVVEFAGRGMSAEDIGRKTGLSPQEIQLILDIRK